MRKKVGIIGPDLEDLGGVSNFYNVLLKHLPSHNYLGIYSLSLVTQVARFYSTFKFISGVDVVIVNPSLQNRALFRDYVYMILARCASKEIICLIHGWDSNVEKKIDKYPWMFRLFSSSIDCVCVLSNQFKDKLLEWVPNVRVELFKTHVDDYFFEKPLVPLSKKIFFVSRITKEKGIFKVLEIHRILSSLDRDFELYVVGDGPSLEDARDMVSQEGIINVTFTGRLSHENTLAYYHRGGQLLFPTEHGEGLPTIVLEALASGLLVYTNAIGGIKDIESSIRGLFLIDDLSPNGIAEMIIENFNDSQMPLVLEQSRNYVFKNFNTKLIVKELDNLISSLS